MPIPSAFRRSVWLFSTASLPVTAAPKLCKSSAKPHIPIPPMPIKCTRDLARRMCFNPFYKFTHQSFGCTRFMEGTNGIFHLFDPLGMGAQIFNGRAQSGNGQVFL